MTHTESTVLSRIAALCMLAILSVLCAALPFVAYAAPVVRSGDTVILNADQKVSGDFYALGGTISTSGAIEGDLYAVGGTVTVNGPVSDDAVFAGGTVSIHGAVGDDIRVVGGQVTIAEHITGDLVVFAGTLSILSTAQIDGDILFYGGRADIGGPVGGSIHSYGESLRIDTRVDGSVTATAHGQISLSPAADIGGNLSYKSSDDLVRAPGSVVVGDISKTTIVDAAERNSVDSAPFFNLLFTLFAVLVTLLVLGKRVQVVVDNIVRGSIAHHGLVGFGVLVLMPLGAGLLMVSVLGILLGIALLLSYFLFLICAWIVAGILTGAYLAKAFTKKTTVSLLWSLAGVLTLHAALVIPFVGPIVLFAALIISLGGLATVLYRGVK